MKKTLVRAAFAACLLGAVSGAALMSGPAFAAPDEKPKVSVAVGKIYLDAQKLLATQDYAGAKAKIAEAQALPTLTPYENYVIDQFINNIAISQSDYATVLKMSELLAASPAEPDADKPGTLHNLIQLEYQAKNYAKTIQYGEELQATSSGLDQVTATALVQAYFFTNDLAKAQALSQKWVDIAIAQKKPPNETMLGILFSAQAKSNDQTNAVKTLELLAQYYSSPSTWDQLIQAALGTQGITNVEGLDLYRLRWTAAAMSKGEDYTLMATIAMQLGYPGEARNVLQQGVQMGRLSSSSGAGPAFQQARTQAAADEKLLPAFAAEAAKSPTGEKDEKLAETYYGYGRFAESEAAVRQAIAKNGLRDPGQAKMLLAMNLVNQGKYQDAVNTLHEVTSGSSARMQAMNLWAIYALHKINEMAASQPAAPAAAAPPPATPAQ